MKTVKGKYRKLGSDRVYHYMVDMVQPWDQMGDLPLLCGCAYTMAIARDGDLKCYYNAALGGWLVPLSTRFDQEMPEKIINHCRYTTEGEKHAARE